MTSAFHPRRSVLYMPASNSRALEKARQLEADVVVFDLEDAVAPEAKDAARSRAGAAARAGGYGHREVVIRANGADTAWFAEDIAMVASSGADAVLLPKVETPATIKETRRLLNNAGAPDDLAIWIMTETPAGVTGLGAILQQHAEVEVVVMGTSDLTKELRIAPDENRTGLLYSLSHCVLTARQAGVDIIDGVHLALDDNEGLEAACRQGRQLGFDGKSLIHPRQIAAANTHFGVTAEAAEDARKIVNVWRAARSSGDGITVVDGKLIEQLHVDEAERQLAIFEATQRS